MNYERSTSYNPFAGWEVGTQFGFAKGGRIYEVGVYAPESGFSLIYIWRIK